MTISVLVRLVAEALATGELAGQAISIATGEEALFRNADELIDFIHAHGDGESGPTGKATSPGVRSPAADSSPS